MFFFVLSLLIIILLIMFGYSWYRLHKEIHVHANHYKDTPKNNGLVYTDFSVKTVDNYKISGWYIPVSSPKAFVILLHGRLTKDGGRAMMISHAKYLHDHGYAAVLFDMRGVGESDGKTITLGVNEWKDVMAVYDYIQTLPEAKNKKIGFMGISMGGVVALIAAGKEKIGDFVIASVPYKSFVSLFTQQVKRENLFPRFLFVWLLALAALFELGPFYFLLNPLRLIKNIKAPILLISAKNDTMIDPRDQWELYEAANKPKEFWQADTTHHVHGELRNEFEDKVINFLRVYGE